MEANSSGVSRRLWTVMVAFRRWPVLYSTSNR